MKTKYLLTLYFFLFIGYAKAQKSSAGYLKADQIYVTYHHQQIKFLSIDLHSVVKLFGKPIKIKKEKWEVNDAKWTRTFIYPDGELVFEDNYMAFITITKPGWAFSFKTKKGFSGLFTIGSYIKNLDKLFPKSYYKVEKSFSLQIYNCDCSLGFDTNGDKITGTYFFTNES